MKKPIGCGRMFKYTQLIEIGLYDRKFLAREEELIHRFKKYKVTRIPVPLYRYRRHENNLTNKKNYEKICK